jgi:hypothetical protein
MLDWITNIWHKPLASWDLLDILGILALIPTSIFLLWFLISIVFVISIRIANPSNKSAAKSMDEQRKSLGYDE